MADNAAADGLATDDGIGVRENSEAHRFEITVGGELAGFTVFRQGADRYDFVHTEIGGAFGGKGLATILIRTALDAVRDRGMAVIPTCPFVRSFIERHPEYVRLVPADQRAAYGLSA